jgi:hypothetical protein
MIFLLRQREVHCVLAASAGVSHTPQYGQGCSFVDLGEPGSLRRGPD